MDSMEEVARQIILLVRPELTDAELDAVVPLAAEAALRASREGFDFDRASAEHEQFEATLRESRP